MLTMIITSNKDNNKNNGYDKYHNAHDFSSRYMSHDDDYDKR